MSDAGPGVEPKCGARGARGRAPGEAERCPQELAALVEHGLFDQPNAGHEPRASARRLHACGCGVLFEKWITLEDSELDVLHFALLN
jgi:hypothetical protein